MTLLRLCLLAVMWCLGSCGPAAIDGGFDSANPAAKMYAIEHAARDGDQSAIPDIVEQLDSDDPAVRSLAIAALKRITGQTFGYRDFDPPSQRREAIERWRAAIESGSVGGAPESFEPGMGTFDGVSHG
jgi:hypothetical protein